MKCPQCQFENPEKMKFCGECGSKLENICPKCNFNTPFQLKFCGDCGHNLRQPRTRMSMNFMALRLNSVSTFRGKITL